MRLQLAHGDTVDLPAGEALCLRFIRDVYGPDSKQSSSTDKNIGEKIGFTADILDIADCFSSHTDKEMLSIIEKKRIMTPHTHRRKRRAAIRVSEGESLHSSAVFRAMMEATAATVSAEDKSTTSATDSTAAVDTSTSTATIDSANSDFIAAAAAAPAIDDVVVALANGSHDSFDEDDMGLGW
jgi:hypothetical protein